MQFEITKDVNISPLDVEKFYFSLSEDSLPVIPDQYRCSNFKTPEAAELATKKHLKLEDLRQRILNGADFATMVILYSKSVFPAMEVHIWILKRGFC